MDCNLPGSSVHGILQARLLEWVAISYFPTQGSNPCLLRLLHWQVISLPLHNLGNPVVFQYPLLNCAAECDPHSQGTGGRDQHVSLLATELTFSLIC